MHSNIPKVYIPRTRVDDPTVGFKIRQLYQIQNLLTKEKTVPVFQCGDIVSCKLGDYHHSHWIVEGDLAYILKIGVVLERLGDHHLIIGVLINNKLKTRIVDACCFELLPLDRDAVAFSQSLINDLTEAYQQYQGIASLDSTAWSPRLPRIRVSGFDPALVFPPIPEEISASLGLNTYHRVFGHIRLEDNLYFLHLGVGDSRKMVQ